MQEVSYLWHRDHTIDTSKQIDKTTSFSKEENAVEFFALFMGDWFEVATDNGTNTTKPVVAEVKHKLSIATLVSNYVKSVAGQVSSRINIIAKVASYCKQMFALLVNALGVPYQRLQAHIQCKESTTSTFMLESSTTLQGGETMAFVGDTVRLQVNLRNYENQPVDIYDVTLKIMDESREVIETIADLARLNKGVFYFDYTVPDGEGDLVYEFEATNTNNKPVIARGKIARKFV